MVCSSRAVQTRKAKTEVRCFVVSPDQFQGVGGLTVACRGARCARQCLSHSAWIIVKAKRHCGIRGFLLRR